ncbi:MAG: hypothetical protein AAF939_12920 [Planctomycetota bacterium]
MPVRPTQQNQEADDSFLAQQQVVRNVFRIMFLVACVTLVVYWITGITPFIGFHGVILIGLLFLWMSIFG